MAHKRLTASQQFEVDKIKRKSIITTIITSVTTLLIGGFIGAKIIHSKYEIYDNPEVQKFMDVYNIMVDEWLYGDEDYEDSLIDNAIDSLVNNDDPYTFYTTKDESQNLTMTQKGLGFRYIYYGCFRHGAIFCYQLFFKFARSHLGSRFNSKFVLWVYLRCIYATCKFFCRA